ncbi:MAG: hypothetical protein AABW52_05765 [Nanoarchaeota archaeon]
MIPDKLMKYDPVLFSKGKRGLIFTFVKNKKTYAIKVKNPSSEAINRINIEADFLRLLNKYKIGPKLIESGDNFIVYEFIPGITLKEFLKTKKLSKKLISDIMSQCKSLDELKINKEEMHHPYKNIIINKNKAYLIDFERCHFTLRVKNVNQFKDFLRDFE